MGDTTGQTLKAEIGLVPILRAGLGMVDGIYRDDTRFSSLAFGIVIRDEATLRPVA